MAFAALSIALLATTVLPEAAAEPCAAWVGHKAGLCDTIHPGVHAGACFNPNNMDAFVQCIPPNIFDSYRCPAEVPEKCSYPAGPVASAGDINLDWSLLTDFTAHYEADMKNIIALSNELHHPLPYTEATEKGTMQADIVNEKLRFKSIGTETFSNGPEAGLLPLRGASGKESGELVLDGSAGFAAFRGTVSMTMQNGMALGPVEYCVKVNLPPQMFPPKEIMQAKLQQGEQMVNAKMANLPPHTQATIDGENVAVWQVPLAPIGRSLYLALRPNGAPFGEGIVPPSGGEWHPYIKFPSWEHGAGDIEEFSCAEAGSTSAVALMAHPEASKMLDVFDNVLDRARTADSMNTALKSFPQRPSQLFKDAAAKELSMAESSMANDMHYAPVVVVAGVAGAVGAFVALAAMKMAKQWSTPSQREAFLSNIA